MQSSSSIFLTCKISKLKFKFGGLANLIRNSSISCSIYSSSWFFSNILLDNPVHRVYSWLCDQWSFLTEFGIHSHARDRTQIIHVKIIHLINSIAFLAQFFPQIYVIANIQMIKSIKIFHLPLFIWFLLGSLLLGLLKSKTLGTMKCQGSKFCPCICKAWTMNLWPLGYFLNTSLDS